MNTPLVISKPKLAFALACALALAAAAGITAGSAGSSELQIVDAAVAMRLVSARQHGDPRHIPSAPLDPSLR